MGKRKRKKHHDSMYFAIGTGLLLKIFHSRKHGKRIMRKAKKIRILISEFKKGKIKNFNPARLNKNPFPKLDNPRGKKDIDSLKYHRELIRNKKSINPIWLLKKDGKLILLDGVHRIISHYLEGKRKITAYLAKYPRRKKSKINE